MGCELGRARPSAHRPLRPPSCPLKVPVPGLSQLPGPWVCALRLLQRPDGFLPQGVLLSPQPALRAPAQSWGPAGLFSESQRRRGLSRLVREGALGKCWGLDVGCGESCLEAQGKNADCKWPWCQCAPLTRGRWERSPTLHLPRPRGPVSRGLVPGGGDQVGGLGGAAGACGPLVSQRLALSPLQETVPHEGSRELDFPQTVLSVTWVTVLLWRRLFSLC